MSKKLIMLIAATVLLAGCASSGPPSKSQIGHALTTKTRQTIKQQMKRFKKFAGKNASNKFGPVPSSIHVQVLKIISTKKLKKNKYEMRVKVKTSGHYKNSNRTMSRTHTNPVIMSRNKNGQWVADKNY